MVKDSFPLNLSVLMPVYNCEKYLDKAIHSIRNQTFTDYEFIIVNDGSTDKSLEIIERHAAEDSRIVIIDQPNGGIVNALNAGLELCRGEYIARMDGDDISLPDRFMKQVAYLDAHPAVVAVGMQCEKIDEQGLLLSPMPCPLDHESIDAINVKYGGGGIAHPSSMIRKQAYDAVGGYQSELEIAEDGDLWLRMAERGELANLPEIGLQYRIHDNQSTSRYLERFIAVERAVREAGLRRNKSYAVELMSHHRNISWAARDAGRYWLCLKHSFLYLTTMLKVRIARLATKPQP